jgi:hypothetical protein
MQVLPQSSQRIRFYGLLATTVRVNNITRIREMLAPVDELIGCRCHNQHTVNMAR